MNRLLCDYCKKEIIDRKRVAVMGLFREGAISNGGPIMNGLPLAGRYIMHQSCADYITLCIQKHKATT